MARIKERRRRRRIDVALPIKVEYNRESILSETKNISILGTYIEIDKEIPRGIALEIGVKIPKTGHAKIEKSREIRCTGIAFRSGPTGLSSTSKNQYGIAIFFRSFLRSGEKDLSRYIDWILLQEKKIGKIYMHKRRQTQKRKGALKRKKRII